MAYKNKIRVMTALLPELDLKVKELSKKTGLSKSCICAQLIKMSLEMEEKKC